MRIDCRRLQSEDGFSLMEMLVVLAIIGLIAAIAGPALNGRRGNSVGEFGTAMMQDMSLARAKAISTQQIVKMEIDLAIREIKPSECCRQLSFPPDVSATVLTGQELIVADRQAAFLFYPDGSASGGQIVLKGSNGAKLTMRLNWIDGSVEAVDD